MSTRIAQALAVLIAAAGTGLGQRAAIPGAAGNPGSIGEVSPALRTSLHTLEAGFEEQAKLIAGDAAADDWFGLSVSLSGDTALVGALLDDDEEVDSGSAYVFVRNGTSWIEEAKLTASDGAPGDFFGVSVALAGDTALVGASADDDNGTNSGSVYVFVRTGTTWAEETKLTASDGMSLDQFGNSVSLSGATALVGAYRDGHGKALQAGSAYVFVRSGTSWIEEAKLTASDGTAFDWFGESVAVWGDTVLVGASQAQVDDNQDAGSAYVFVRSGTSWLEEAKLTASDGTALDRFGESSSVCGDTALVGAPRKDGDSGSYSGAAYVFARNGTNWSEQAKLMASDGAALDLFGYSVSLANGTALVGAYQDDDNGSLSGSAYVFALSRTSWTEEAKLTASDGTENDSFGVSVSLSGDAALVGAYRDDENGSFSGSAYVFAPPPPAVYCTAGVSASGCQAALGSTGEPSATVSAGFSLVASSVEGLKDGLFFFGTNGQQASPWGNGTSYQCVAPPVKRCGLLAGTGAVGACDGTLSQDLNALWCPTCPKPGHNPGAGSLVQAQLWYRDPLSTSNQTTSLSDAIEFAVGP